MTKYYIVTGKSTAKPTGLPAGFEVEETEEKFVRTIDVDDGDHYRVRVEDDGCGGVHIALIGGQEVLEALYFTRSAETALRDALTEHLGDEPSKPPTAPAVVNHGDPEPPRDAVYVDEENYTWSYNDSFEEWCYAYKGGTPNACDTWSGLMHRDPGRTVADFPWTLKV